MQGLPILNPRLSVEVTGCRDFDGQQLCVLITPWFMNLVAMPGSAEMDNVPIGEFVSLDLPHESLEFTVSRDAEIGTYLSAVLFRTMTDFPDQQTAREVAEETMRRLFLAADRPREKLVNRRALFTGLGGG